MVFLDVSQCEEVATASGVEQVNQNARDAFVRDLDVGDLKVDEPIRLPLNYDSIEAEINLISLMDLLNVGSGYDDVLAKLAGRDAFDTIRFGCMSMHISGMSLQASDLKKLTVIDVAETFQIPVDQDVHPENMPFLTMTEPTAAVPFAKQITTALNDLGSALVDAHCKDLATFILSKSVPVKDGKPSAAKMVDELARLLPSFRDEFNANGTTCYLLRNIQALVYHLYTRFKQESPEHFDYADLDTLTALVDHVVPMVLVERNILTLPAALQDKIDRKELLSREEAGAIRAGAVAAIHTLAKDLQRVKGVAITDIALGLYISILAQDQTPRLRCRDGSF